MDEHRWQSRLKVDLLGRWWWARLGRPLLYFYAFLLDPSRPFVAFLETNPSPAPTTILSLRSFCVAITIAATTTEFGTVSCLGSDYLTRSSCSQRERQVRGLEKAAISYGGAFRLELWNRQEGQREVPVVGFQQRSMSVATTIGAWRFRRCCSELCVCRRMA